MQSKKNKFLHLESLMPKHQAFEFFEIIQNDKYLS